MPNNVINKVVYGDRTLIDLTDTTATAETILSGYGAYGADGVWVDGTATAGSLSGHVWQDNEGYIHLDDDGGDMYITTPLNVTTNGTYTAPTGVAYTPVSVNVSSSPTLQAKTNISPTTSSQTITADTGYDGLSSVQINAMPSGSATTPATTVTANPSISVNSSGLITATASATKSVTPTVSAGYVSSGTAGTITVSGSNTSQLTTQAAQTIHPSSSDQTITSGKYLTGTQTIKGVTATNLSAGNIKSGVTVEIGDSTDSDCVTSVTGTYTGGATHTATITGSGAKNTCRVIYDEIYYYTDGQSFTFATGDNISLACIARDMNAYVYVDGTQVAFSQYSWASYDYTAPNHDIEIQLSYNWNSSINVVFPTISITTNGNKQDIHEYYYADVNVSGGGAVEQKQINFIDYDGTLVASKTKAEINAMTSDSDLPANPSHTGLTAQGWNWTVAQLKAQLTAVPDGDVWVGQLYVTASGDTEIDVVMQDSRLEPMLTIAVNGTVTVDWGDNTTADTVTGTSLSTRQEVPHTYASAGNYTIVIHITSGTFTFYGSTSSLLLRKNSAVASESRVYANCVCAVRLGSGVTSIGNGAFYYCYSLSSVTIPSSVTSIGSNVFNSCYNLSSVTIPYGVTSIGDSAFTNCSILSNIAMPSSVTSIGSTAFYSCYSLSNITIPSSVTSIGNTAFTNCSGLSSITIPSNVTSIGGSAFYSCSSLSNITIPNGITSIGNSVFSSCYGLFSITIPSSVTSIGNSVFATCTGMAEYHVLPTTPPTLGTTVFSSIPSDCKIYVPSSSLSDYQTAWSDYASYLVGE